MQDASRDTHHAVDPPEPTGEVCCELGGKAESDSQQPISQRSRVARALVGAGFLAVAGAIATRRTPGGIALWPGALVPTWFGISHLVAAQIGYPGCPELGAIPSVLYGRTITTQCRPWEKTDRWLNQYAR